MRTSQEDQEIPRRIERPTEKNARIKKVRRDEALRASEGSKKIERNRRFSVVSVADGVEVSLSDRSVGPVSGSVVEEAGEEKGEGRGQPKEGGKTTRRDTSSNSFDTHAWISEGVSLIGSRGSKSDAEVVRLRGFR